MGTTIVQAVNKQMPDCCNQVVNEKQGDLRVQTSNSKLLREEAKHKNIPNNKSTLRLPTSPKSTTRTQSLSINTISDDIIYSLESSDSCNDEILLSNTLINSKSTKPRVFIKIPSSSTKSADHKLETCRIPTQTNKNIRTNKKPTYKNRRNKSKITIKTNKNVLLKELSDCEIKLKQQQHEKDILKRENAALRRKILQLDNEYNGNNKHGTTGLSLDLSPKSSTTNKSTCCELLSPSNIVLSPSISLNQSISPSAYSTCSPSCTNTATICDENEPQILNVKTKINHDRSKQTSVSIPKFSDTENEELKSNEIIINCKGVKECRAINGVILALKWYSTNGNNHENVYKKMKNKNYGMLVINYYNHIMEYHFNENNKNIKNIANEYKLICDKINKNVKQCTFKCCNGYRRYLRSKNCSNVHKAQTLKQHELQMYVNTMDGIHACFMHLSTSFQFQ